MTFRRLGAAALPVLAVLAASAPAAAAPAVANATAAPADTAAGAHSDFTIAFDVTGLGNTGAGGDDLKSLQLDLPPGLVGNPLATKGTCSKEQLTADACPATTRVGSTTVTADAALAGGAIPLGQQTIQGDIYNVKTSGPEAARLGIVLRPELGLPKVILESPVVLRATDGGLTSTVDGISRTSTSPGGDVELRIERMALTLLGKLESGAAFMTNPTSCAPATTTITIGTYDGQAASAPAGFTPTACAALPFAPQLSARIGTTRDDVRAGGQPEIVVTVTQSAGEANARTVSVALPAGLGASIAALGNACPLASYDAGTCPAASILGSATANSPLLPGPLTGPVTFVSDPAAGLPQLRVALRGAFAVNLTGVVTLGSSGGLVNTFDGIFDVPLSRFVLNLAAGKTSPVQVSRDLCLPGRGSLTGTFTAHSGKVATDTAEAVLPGCDIVSTSTISARLAKRATRRPVLSLSVANVDRAVRAMTFRLPKGLRFTARARKLARVTAAGVTSRVRLKSGRMTVRLSGVGASKVGLVLRRGAIRRIGRPGRRLSLGVRLVGEPVERTSVRLR